MNYQYFGLFLEEEYRENLMDIIISNPIIANLVLQRESTIYLDHCTLLHKNSKDEEVLNNLISHLKNNITYRLIINEIGISNKAIAFRVEIGDPTLMCTNAKPHITICTINGGKPVDSNEIVNWIPIQEYSVYCKLKMVK